VNRGERLIKFRDSWFSVKSIEVEWTEKLDTKSRATGLGSFGETYCDSNQTPKIRYPYSSN